VENLVVHNTTPWLSYASWTWEVLRRNPDYVRYYNSLKYNGLETVTSSNMSIRINSSRRFPTANKFGLVAPADPSQFADEVPVLWHPDVFNSVVRFYVIDPDTLDKTQKPIQLSKFPGQKLHFLDANGTYHIRILGKRFWFQLKCEDVDYVDDDAFIGLAINDLTKPDKRLKTFKEMGEIYNGSLALDSRLHTPAKLEYHQRSTLVYDIRESGGTLLDAVEALKDAKLLVENPDKYTDFKEVAQNAYRAGKAYIYGDYLKILNRR